ncbi:hypothetical protein PISMIDRAFT_673345, partial [Pisolithus microcarpus 441]
MHTNSFAISQHLAYNEPGHGHYHHGSYLKPADGSAIASATNAACSLLPIVLALLLHR